MQEEGICNQLDQHTEEEGVSTERDPSISIRQFLPGLTMGEVKDGVSMRQFSPSEGESIISVVLLDLEIEGGGEGMGGEAFQLGMASGSMHMVVPGRRLTSCSSRCLRKVTWKELKMLPSIVSQRW
jgi:hypothetical protein